MDIKNLVRTLVDNDILNFCLILERDLDPNSTVGYNMPLIGLLTSLSTSKEMLEVLMSKDVDVDVSCPALPHSNLVEKTFTPLSYAIWSDKSPTYIRTLLDKVSNVDVYVPDDTRPHENISAIQYILERITLYDTDPDILDRYLTTALLLIMHGARVNKRDLQQAVL